MNAHACPSSTRRHSPKPHPGRAADHPVCRAILDNLQRTRAAILGKYQHASLAPEPMLRQVLTEAEALAWESGFPHLLFPELAAEKADSLATWYARQQFLLASTREPGRVAA